MDKASKAIRREAALLWHHFLEVREHWRAILGAVAVIALFAVVRWALSGALPAVTPYLPAAIVPWLSWHRLTVAAVVFLVLLAQYLAWRKQYLANHPEGPDIDDRLELLPDGEAPGLTPPESRASRELGEALALEPFPDHIDTIRLRARAEIEPPLLDIRCTAPIYAVICIYHLPGEEPITTMEPVLRRPDRILMKLGEKPLSAGTGVLLKLFSPVPIQLKRIAIGRQR